MSPRIHKLRGGNYFVARAPREYAHAPRAFTPRLNFLSRTYVWVTVTTCRKFTTIALHVIPGTQARDRA